MRTDLPEMKDMATLKFFVSQLNRYYKNLPDDKQTQYAAMKQDIDTLKTKKGL